MRCNYDKLPFLNQGKEYSAYFAEAGGLMDDAAVQVSGFQVGKVESIELDGPRVLVKFTVDKDIRLGDRTEAAIKTKGLLGTKILEVTPRGDGQQDGTIPLDRTTSPYQLPDALGDLATTISGLNTDQLSDSLRVLSETFADTPPQLKIAVEGVARFSETLNERDAQLRGLLANANKATTVLAERSDQVVSLVANTNALLAELRDPKRRTGSDLRQHLRAVSQQLQGFIGENRETLKPALDKLNGVLTILDNRKERLQKSLNLLNAVLDVAGRIGGVRARSSRPTSPTCCPASSCSRSSTPRSPTSVWIPTCCCRRSAPTRRSASRARRRCRCRSRGPARAAIRA